MCPPNRSAVLLSPRHYPTVCCRAERLCWRSTNIDALREQRRKALATSGRLSRPTRRQDICRPATSPTRNSGDELALADLCVDALAQLRLFLQHIIDRQLGDTVLRQLREYNLGLERRTHGAML